MASWPRIPCAGRGPEQQRPDVTLWTPACAGDAGRVVRVAQVAVLGLSLILSACTPATPSETVPAPRPDIASTDFVLLPCGPGEADRPCALLMAGGKRVLFGAPAGVLEGLSEEDLANLDAVMLFSLRGIDIEGLDEVRNASWRAGRVAPLKVSGPEGTAEMIAALNLAYEASDAISFVEHGAKGGYDSAVLIRGGNEGKAFDTGDLQVLAISSDQMSFLISYNQTHLLISGCFETGTGVFSAPDLSLRIDCSDSEPSWPLTAPIFISK